MRASRSFAGVARRRGVATAGRVGPPAGCACAAARSSASAAGITWHARPFHASATAAGKVIPFNLPDIGEGIAEVEILAWHVKAGDKVAQFDKLLEVQSDKATVDITSRYDGVVRKLHHAVGDMAPTGKPLLDIELDGGGDGGHDAPAAAAAGDAPAASSSSSSNSDAAATGGAEEDAGSLKNLATPAVRRLAREHNLSLSSIRGTGKDGRVLKEDILRFVAEGGGNSAAAPAAPAAAAATRAAAPAPAAAAPAPASSAAAAAPIPAPVVRSAAGGGVPADTRVPVRGLARAMAKSMTGAWAAPHFGYCDEVVMDGLMGVRAALKPAADAAGLKLSFLPFIIKATSVALGSFPQLNAHVAGDASELVHKGAHNIGVAMDTPRGLIVPNVKAVQQLSVFEIASELGRLQALAAAGKLGEADLADGTFTLSNIGTIGGTYASPVLFAPQVAIGAIGKITKLPRYASTLPGAAPAKGASSAAADPIVPAHVMTVSWSADHRVVDGATMARFGNAWKRLLENPTLLLAELR